MLHDCKYFKKTSQDDLVGVRFVARPNTGILTMTSIGVFESQLPNITKVSKTKPSSAHQNDMNDDGFQWLGINEKSVRGLTVKQVKKLLTKIKGEVRILVRSPDNTVVHLKCYQKLFLCYDDCFVDQN